MFFCSLLLVFFVGCFDKTDAILRQPPAPAQAPAQAVATGASGNVAQVSGNNIAGSSSQSKNQNISIVNNRLEGFSISLSDSNALLSEKKLKFNYTSKYKGTVVINCVFSFDEESTESARKNAEESTELARKNLEISNEIREFEIVLDRDLVYKLNCKKLFFTYDFIFADSDVVKRNFFEGDPRILVRNNNSVYIFQEASDEVVDIIPELLVTCSNFSPSIGDHEINLVVLNVDDYDTQKVAFEINGIELNQKELSDLKGGLIISGLKANLSPFSNSILIRVYLREDNSRFRISKLSLCEPLSLSVRNFLEKEIVQFSSGGDSQSQNEDLDRFEGINSLYFWCDSWISDLSRVIENRSFYEENAKFLFSEDSNDIIGRIKARAELLSKIKRQLVEILNYAMSMKNTLMSEQKNISFEDFLHGLLFKFKFLQLYLTDSLTEIQEANANVNANANSSVHSGKGFNENSEFDESVSFADGIKILLGMFRSLPDFAFHDYLLAKLERVYKNICEELYKSFVNFLLPEHVYLFENIHSIDAVGLPNMSLLELGYNRQKLIDKRICSKFFDGKNHIYSWCLDEDQILGFARSLLKNNSSWEQLFSIYQEFKQEIEEVYTSVTKSMESNKKTRFDFLLRRLSLLEFISTFDSFIRRESISPLDCVIGGYFPVDSFTEVYGVDMEDLSVPIKYFNVFIQILNKFLFDCVDNSSENSFEFVFLLGARLDDLQGGVRKYYENQIGFLRTRFCPKTDNLTRDRYEFASFSREVFANKKWKSNYKTRE